VLAIAGLLMCLSLPIFPHDLQAYGNNLAATAVIAGGLVWHILHPAADTAVSANSSSVSPSSVSSSSVLSSTTGKLQPDTQISPS
jgi:hypothetical protein